MNEPIPTAEATAAPLPEGSARPYAPDEHERARPMRTAPAPPAARRTRTAREPLARAERILIALFAGLLALVAAAITAGTMAFTTLRARMLDLQERIGGLRGEMHQESGALRTDLSERMTRVEERLTVGETVLRIRHGSPPAR